MAGAPFLPASRDTIFAPASGAGRAAIAVIRISGPRCAAALAALAPGKAFPDRVATLATLSDPASGEALDRALVVRFVAPKSFTGEEMAELQATGGRATVAGIVAALARLPGLRPAEPGEFAWRAFENGKLDLERLIAALAAKIKEIEYGFTNHFRAHRGFEYRHSTLNWSRVSPHSRRMSADSFTNRYRGYSYQ